VRVADALQHLEDLEALRRRILRGLPARGESWPSVSVDRYLPVRNPSRARSTARARAELLRDRDDVVLGLAVDEVVVRLDRDGLGDAEVTCDAHPRAMRSAE
jgi:hypothetical protein